MKSMLTREAFNALLMEEPPARAMFILCTTDPEKYPRFESVSAV